MNLESLEYYKSRIYRRLEDFIDYKFTSTAVHVNLHSCGPSLSVHHRYLQLWSLLLFLYLMDIFCPGLYGQIQRALGSEAPGLCYDYSFPVKYVMGPVLQHPPDNRDASSVLSISNPSRCVLYTGKRFFRL